MANCRSCGGVLGRDCFNESECEWIGQQQEIQAAVQESERSTGQEIEALKAENELLKQRIEAVEKLIAKLSGPARKRKPRKWAKTESEGGNNGRVQR